jgi:hypothetical protein
MLLRDRAIEALLADPMVGAVMKADRVDAGELERTLRDVRSRLLASSGRSDKARDDVAQDLDLPDNDLLSVCVRATTSARTGSFSGLPNRTSCRLPW